MPPEELEELPRVKADSFFEIWVTCPHCDVYQLRTYDLTDYLDANELRAEECEVELRCEEVECSKSFIVESVVF
jgi:hypothetical protein